LGLVGDSLRAAEVGVRGAATKAAVGARRAKPRTRERAAIVDPFLLYEGIYYFKE
jgi:hypothetical protein